IYMGTCEGYVFYMNGTKVAGANVTVKVVGCTTPPQNCVRNATTDSGGYYVIANLNLPPNGSVSVTAQKGNYYGTNASQADAYQAAYVNVTLCEAPTSPALVPVNDSHYPNITFWFNWTSGSSPYSTFDQWYWQGSWQNATSPQSRTNLPFANYSWGARTCLNNMSSCCSPPAYDFFSVYNHRPCMPILTPQNDTTNNTVILNWTSNMTAPCPDADNDPTYYNFRIDGNLTTNATPPKVVSGLGGGWHTWQVQECDPWECSDWVTDTFNIYNTACPAPNLTDQNHSCSKTVTLRWQSATIDPDGDPCHDEFNFNGSIIYNATSPQTISLTEMDYYTWQVRSCDNKGACSPWISDSFIYCGCIGNVTVEEECKRRFGGAGVRFIGYELVIYSPKELYPGDNFEIKANLKPFDNIVNLSFSADTPEGIAIEPVNYGPVKRNEEITVLLKGKVSLGIEENTYIGSIKAYDNKDILINKPVEFKIVLPPSTIIGFLRAEWPYLPLYLLLLLLILIACIYLLKKVLRKLLKDKNKGIGMIEKIKEEVKKV
ncbi:MAG: carboxypeptidase-like regulatory domain-containing protein, partial [Candidatus Pacearchaeota archaeon]|nr:carboxypeptidase-like regulatory domain-containing protein [Candidatus Pacearchaeota archaeon]